MFELEMGELCKEERRNPDRQRSEEFSDVDAGTIGAAAPAPDMLAKFWSTVVRDERIMEALGMERPRICHKGRVHAFVSHAWPLPQNFADSGPAVSFGEDQEEESAQMTYGRLKACEFAIAARRITREVFGSPEGEWPALSCWLDKACNDPANVGSRPAPEGIERMLQRADHLIVLLSWNYFNRLWCLYEWAVYLCAQPATSLYLRMVPLQTGRNTGMWLQAIMNISVKEAECELEEDKRVLEEKVGLYFRGSSLARSFRTLDRFVQYTAIALITTANAEYLASERVLPIFFDPWVALAKRLEFHDLAAALNVLVSRSTRRPDLPLVCWWHQESSLEGDADLFRKRIRAWFDREVTPLIEAERTKALRPAAFDLLGPRSPLAEASTPVRTALQGDSTALACANAVYNRTSDLRSGMDFPTFLRIHDQVLGRAGGLRIEPHVYFSDPAQLFGYFTNAQLHAEVTRYDANRLLAGFGLGAHQFEIYASAVLQTVGRRDFMRRFSSIQGPRVELPGFLAPAPAAPVLRTSNSVPTMNSTQSTLLINRTALR
jgi:hypothetical protein